jgi:hypothetical protein
MPFIISEPPQVLEAQHDPSKSSASHEGCLSVFAARLPSFMGSIAGPASPLTVLMVHQPVLT